jgi:hypothetical protein
VVRLRVKRDDLIWGEKKEKKRKPIKTENDTFHSTNIIPTSCIQFPSTTQMSSLSKHHQDDVAYLGLDDQTALCAAWQELLLVARKAERTLLFSLEGFIHQGLSTLFTSEMRAMPEFSGGRDQTSGASAY